MAGNINTLFTAQFVSAAATVQNQVATRGFKVIDVVYNVGSTAANNSNIRRSTAAVPATFADTSTAIATATTNQIVYTVDVVPAQATFAVGDTLQYQPTGTSAVVANVQLIPTTWIAG